VIDDGFARRGYDAIVARADHENVASLRALARFGFVTSDDDYFFLQRGDWHAPE
jgi:RimJ/RimL family protein N-acetyltransferase